MNFQDFRCTGSRNHAMKRFVLCWQSVTRIWRPYKFWQGIFSVRIIKGFVIQSIKIPNVQDHMIPLTRYFYSELLKKELWKYLFCIKCYLKILVPLWNSKVNNSENDFWYQCINAKMTLTKPFRKIIKPANLAISAFFKPFVTSQFP